MGAPRSDAAFASFIHWDEDSHGYVLDPDEDQSVSNQSNQEEVHHISSSSFRAR
jgi:hypothetical protein